MYMLYMHVELEHKSVLHQILQHTDVAAGTHLHGLQYHTNLKYHQGAVQSAVCIPY